MARHSKNSRTTAATPVAAVDAVLPPLRKRKPAVFWFVMIATAAMVLTTFAGFLQALG